MTDSPPPDDQSADGPSPTAGGPVWTAARVAYVCALTFGMRRQRADTTATATALQVHPTTVRRWLRTPVGQPVRMQPATLQRLWQRSRPSEESLRQEDLNASYALDAIRAIARPRGQGVRPEWERQRWLEPHLVAVLEPTGQRDAGPAVNLGFRQVATSRAGERPLQELRRRGPVVDFTTVATRFHATALTVAVLRQMDPWRLVVPPRLVTRGGTQTWTSDAPATDVAGLAVTRALR